VTSSTLDGLAAESSVFIDANIFVYHFTAASAACRRLLGRCAEGTIHGVTSLPVLLEVAHRLMIIEAQQDQLVRGSNPGEKLARLPNIVRKLRRYEEWTLAIPRMGIEVEEVTQHDFIASLAVRRTTGLLTLDALIVAVMRRLRLAHLASADHGFRSVAGLSLLEPDDLHAAT
jgi:predicted nucleic acid-binding protein